MRYQEHLPRALRGVSLQTRAGEKVGVVGRTGSGKSSLFQCLFRLTEIEAGEVHIDNVNIKLLDLEELRGQLVIIPQQPFLFRWENINLSRCIAMDGWMDDNLFNFLFQRNRQGEFGSGGFLQSEADC